MIEPENYENNSFEEIDRLQAEMELFTMRLERAKLENKEINGYLAEISQQRETGKIKHQSLEQCSQQLGIAEEEKECRAIKAQVTLLKRDKMLEQFTKMCEENELDALLKSECQQAKELVHTFDEAREQMPWVAEKREQTEHLERVENRLTSAYEQISEIGQEVALVRNTLACHEEMPFKIVCLTLAEYKRKSAQLDRLIKREQKANKEHQDKYEVFRKQPNALFNDTLISVTAPLADEPGSAANGPPFILEKLRAMAQSPTITNVATKVHFGAVNTIEMPADTEDEGSTTRSSRTQLDFGNNNNVNNASTNPNPDRNFLMDLLSADKQQPTTSSDQQHVDFLPPTDSTSLCSDFNMDDTVYKNLMMGHSANNEDPLAQFKYAFKF